LSAVRAEGVDATTLSASFQVGQSLHADRGLPAQPNGSLAKPCDPGNPLDILGLTASGGRATSTAMMTRSQLGVVSVVLFSACGGTPPPPAAPPPVAVASAAPVAPASAPPEEAVSSEPPSEPAAPAAPSEAPTPPSEPSSPLGTQKAIDIITARDAAFLIDYNSSAHKPASEERCEKESKGDAEKRAACLTKARDQFQPDVLRFRRDSPTQVSLLVYKRNGSQLTEISVGVVQLSEEGTDGVKLKFKGQKGTRPIWRGRSEATIRVPNTYTVEFEEPDLGHLRYDAKVGLVSN
jgi:hypothetical protein